MGKRFQELMEEAELPKPYMYSSFVWMRAAGKRKKKIAEELGVNRKTLTRWEDRVKERLEPWQRLELVFYSVRMEFLERGEDCKKVEVKVDGEGGGS